MSDSVWHHRRQSTRLHHPWDSPGKNTGVGCHFLLQCIKVKSESEVAQSCPTLSDPMDCSLPGSFVHGIFQARVLEWGAIAFSMPGLRRWLRSNVATSVTEFCTQSNHKRHTYLLIMNFTYCSTKVILLAFFELLCVIQIELTAFL